MSRKPHGSLDADETAFQQRVVDFARTAGWKVNHTYRGKVGKGAWRTNTTSKGFPDLQLLKPGRLVVLELKMPGNEPTPEQKEWIAWFQTVEGCEAYVVWPADWDEIVDLLTG